MSSNVEVGLFDDDVIDVNFKTNKDFENTHNCQPSFSQNENYRTFAPNFESCRKYEVQSPLKQFQTSGYQNPPSIQIIDTESFASMNENKQTNEDMLTAANEVL